MTGKQLLPTLRTDRISELDLWRGFALFGVCVVNFVQANSDLLTTEQAASFATAGIDWRINRLVNILLSNKAHTIFSILFGLGIALIIERAEQAGVAPTKLLLKRLLILLAFGWVHGITIYYGDILHIYALLGMLVPLIRYLSNRTIIITGLLLALVARLLYEERSFFLSLLDMGALSSASPSTFVSPAKLCSLEESMTLSDFVGLNAARYLATETDWVRRFSFDLYYLGRIMLGFAVWRSGLPRRLFALDTNRIWALFACLLMLAATLTGHAYLAESGPPGTIQRLIYNGLRQANILVIAATYLVGLTAVARMQSFVPVTAALISVGRMSLSNYVLQSFGIALIIFGPGFSFGGDIGVFAVALIAISFFAFQILLSQLWLRNFSQGPLEWCWRKMIYA